MQGPQQFKLEDRWQGSSISRQGSYQATRSLARILLAAARAILQIPVHNSVRAGPTVTTHTKPTLLFLTPPTPPQTSLSPTRTHTHINQYSTEVQLGALPNAALLKSLATFSADKGLPPKLNEGGNAKTAPKLQMWQYRASQHYPRNWPQGCLQESTLISPSYPQQKGDADPPLMNWRARWF